MLKADDDQLGLANNDIFGQCISERKLVREKSGDFTFYSLWEPWQMVKFLHDHWLHRYCDVIITDPRMMQFEIPTTVSPGIDVPRRTSDQ